MLSLLRADLRRINRPRAGFRGYLVLLLLMIVATVVVFKLVSGLLANTAEGAGTSLETYDSATTFLAVTLTSLGVVGALSCWSATSICWIDMRNGYDRSIISSVGKHVYYGEKLLLALVVSAIFMVVGSVFSIILALVMGSLASFGSVVGLIGWIVVATVVIWSCAALSLTVLWLLRNQVLSYLLGLCLCTGIGSSLVGLALSSLPEVAQAWGDLSGWFPKGAFGVVNAVSDSFIALDGESLAHLLVPTAICLVVSFAVANTVLRRRDI